MLENPILNRELTTALRARLTFVLAIVYLAGLGTIVWALWPTEGVFSLAAQASRAVVLVFSVTQLLLVMLYAPAFGATAITVEKEQNSYELLFTTQMPPHAIVTGKLLSSVVSLLLFVALSVPLFAACFFLGAVSVPETIVIYGVTALTALLFALLGLSISALKSSSQGALVTTYLLILLLNAGPWIPYFIFQTQPQATVIVHVIRSLSPLAAIASVVVPTFDPGIASWKLYVPAAVAASVAMVAFLLGAVYRSARRPVHAQARVVDDPKELAKRKLQFPFYLIDPIRRRGHIPDWLNPIFAKEMRAKAFGGGIWIFRSAYACLAVSMVLMAMVAGNLAMQSPDVIRSVALIFQLGVIVLVVPSLTVGAVTGEREQGNLDLLRQTRIGAASFLTGKLMMAAVFVVFIAVGSLPLWFTIHYMRTNTLHQILVAWAIIGSTILLAMSTGLFSSSVAGKTSSATGLAYALLALVCVATLFPLLAAKSLTASLRDTIFSLNPFISAIQALASEFFGESRELWRSHITFTVAVSIVFLVAAGLRVWRMLLPEK